MLPGVPRARTMNPRWLAFLVGLLLGAGLLLYNLRSEGEPLTAEGLRRARDLWSRNGPTSYDLELRMGGRQAGEYRIEVREGVVSDMTTDGAPAAEHAERFWTVEGLLDFLETELWNAENPRESYGVTDPDAVSLVVHFDPEHGLPWRFFRHVRQRRMDVDWQVLGFTRR